jgi:hypothetical protein
MQKRAAALEAAAVESARRQLARAKCDLAAKEVELSKMSTNLTHAKKSAASYHKLLRNCSRSDIEWVLYMVNKKPRRTGYNDRHGPMGSQ